MSEPEFEMYLSLMSKFLRLNAAQKHDISEELRVHLEDRLAELQDQGKSRDEAIRLALDEFGDAGALAWQFTLPHSLRRRRQIMRYSIGSFVALAGIFTLVSLTWPNRPDTPPSLQTVVAQGESSPTVVGLQPPGETLDAAALERREIEEKLSSREHAFEFANINLNEALLSLSQQVDLPLVFSVNDRENLENTLISLQTPKGALSIRSALELILRQSQGGQLTYSIKDGVILISDGSEDYEVQVYDCRDLLANVPMQGGNLPQGGMGGGGMGGGFFSVPAELAGAAVAQFGGGGGGGMGGGGNPNPDVHRASASSTEGAALMSVIKSATQPAEWVDLDGQGGSMSEFKGVIVVRHHQAVHRKIEEVLTKLRKVKRAQIVVQSQPEDIKSLDIPAGKRLVTVQANQWVLPVEAKIRPGSRVDLVVVKSDGRTDAILENLEIAWLDAYQTQVGESTKAVTMVQQLGFIVNQDIVEQLMLVENGNTGHLHFMLRGEEEDEEKESEEADQKPDGEEVEQPADLSNVTPPTPSESQTLDIPLRPSQVAMTALLATLPESVRDRVRMKMEPVAIRIGESRFYPLVGSARLLHIQHRGQIDYSNVDLCDRPQELRDLGTTTQIVYYDEDQLIR